MAGEIGHHHEGSAEHTYQEDLLACVVSRDLLTDLGQSLLDLVLGNQRLHFHLVFSLAKTER